MGRIASLFLMLAGVVALVAPTSAVAKLPPGASFEACGVSGCETATAKESFELQLKLIEAAAERGSAVSPAGAAPWIRVDLSISAVRGGADARAEAKRRLGWVLGSFPVVFVPDHGYIGVPHGSRSYRWVRLRTRQAEAYKSVADTVQPFPRQRLSRLNPISVTRTKGPGATSAAVDGAANSAHTLAFVILALGTLGLLAAAGVAVRALRGRGDPRKPTLGPKGPGSRDFG